MRLISFIFTLLVAFPALAGFPPTTTKAIGDANPVTTFNFGFPHFSVTRSGITTTFDLLDVTGGGTGVTSFTPYAVIAGGTTSTGPLQSIASVGTTGQVLTSNGAGALPTFQTSASSGITSINGDSTAAQTLSVGTAGTDFHITDAGGGSHVFNLPTASATNRGALSSADWTTFNNKFDLPALTDGSVLFSDGTTIAQDNANFYWDEAGKTLALGGVFGPPGTVPYAQTSQRTVTNPSGIDGSIFGIHYSNNSANTGSLNTSGYFEGRIQIDSGITTAANAGVIFQAYRNNGASDAGTLQYLVGAFGGAHQIGTDPAAVTGIVAGVLSQVDMSSGTATTAADFYGLSGTSSGGTITNGPFGVYIEPPSSGFKDNFFSGKMLVGGSSYASHGEVLKVNGDMSAIISTTDVGADAGIFNATSNTTVNGSNTTIGINGAAQALVQSGAINDKEVGGMNFSVTRGDGTDDGNLSTMTGANTLLFHNSGAAGTTDNVFGFSTLFFSQQGTATNLYDFYSERVPAGTGVVTNHYGVYIKSDSTTPVQSWLGDHAQVGGTSFVASTNALEIAGALGLRNSGFQVSFVAPTLSASTAYTLPAADGSSGQFLSTNGSGLLSWASQSSTGSGSKVDAPSLPTPTGNTQILFSSTDAEYVTDPGYLTTANQITIVSTGIHMLNVAAHVQTNVASGNPFNLFYSINGGPQVAIQLAQTTSDSGSNYLYSGSTPLSLIATDVVTFFVVSPNDVAVDQIKLAVNTMFGTGSPSSTLPLAIAMTTVDTDVTNPGTDTFDGITLTTGQTLLLVGESGSGFLNNGLWIFDTTSTPMTRPTGWMTGNTVANGQLVEVAAGGNGYGSTIFQVGADSVVGTDPIGFVQVAGYHGWDGNFAINTSLSIGGSVSLGGNIIPTANVTYTAGSSGQAFSQVWSKAFPGPSGATNIVMDQDALANIDGIQILNSGGPGQLDVINFSAMTLRSNGAYPTGMPLRFYDANSPGTNYVGFQAPASMAGNSSYILPAADGTGGEFLQTDGAGNLSWSGAAFAKLPRGTSDPTAPAGSIYYNTGTNKIRWYNGTAWADLL